MTASIKHKFVSPKADGTHSDMLQPSNWNAEHDVTGIVLSVNGSTPDDTGNVTVSGGGAVDSVNTQTGVVVLDAADVGAVANAGGTPSVVTSPTAPASPATGELWIDTSIPSTSPYAYTRVLKQTGAASSALTGTVAETAMATWTMPGNTMGPNDVLRITAHATSTGTGNKTLAVRFGGIAGDILSSAAGTTNNLTFSTTILVRNENSQTSQTSTRIITTTGVFSGNAIAGTQNTGNPVDIVFTGTLVGAGDTMTLRGYTIELLPEAP